MIEENLARNGRRSIYVISLHLSGGNEENPLKLGQDIQRWRIFYYVTSKLLLMACSVGQFVVTVGAE